MIVKSAVQIRVGPFRQDLMATKPFAFVKCLGWLDQLSGSSSFEVFPLLFDVVHIV